MFLRNLGDMNVHKAYSLTVHIFSNTLRRMMPGSRHKCHNDSKISKTSNISCFSFSSASFWSSVFWSISSSFFLAGESWSCSPLRIVLMRCSLIRRFIRMQVASCCINKSSFITTWHDNCRHNRNLQTNHGRLDSSWHQLVWLRQERLPSLPPSSNSCLSFSSAFFSCAAISSISIRLFLMHDAWLKLANPILDCFFCTVASDGLPCMWPTVGGARGTRKKTGGSVLRVFSSVVNDAMWWRRSWTAAKRVCHCAESMRLYFVWKY